MLFKIVPRTRNDKTKEVYEVEYDIYSINIKEFKFPVIE